MYKGKIRTETAEMIEASLKSCRIIVSKQLDFLKKIEWCATFATKRSRRNHSQGFLVRLYFLKQATIITSSKNYAEAAGHNFGVCIILLGKEFIAKP